MIFKVLISTESSVKKRTKTYGKMDGFRFPHFIYKPSTYHLPHVKVDVGNGFLQVSDMLFTF